MRIAQLIAGLAVTNALSLDKRGVTTGIAGGGLQVCNGTPLDLHISLRQLGPMYYQNWVRPGECMTRNGIGNVWFGIQARVATIENEYNDCQVAMPIVGAVCTALSLVCPLVTAGVNFAVRSVDYHWLFQAQLYGLRSARVMHHS